jgi:uncharacterized protein
MTMNKMLLIVLAVIVVGTLLFTAMLWSASNQLLFPRWKGLTNGERESRDILSAYLYLSRSYPNIYAMGTSMGALSLLAAAPAMPGLRALIAENPMISFRRLLTGSPQGRNIPAWLSTLVIRVTTMRGRFDGLIAADNALRLVHGLPIFFIHSKADQIVPYQQTEELANAYQGPKTSWFPAKGNHAEIWNVDQAAYEQRLSDFLDSLALPIRP